MITDVAYCTGLHLRKKTETEIQQQQPRLWPQMPTIGTTWTTRTTMKTRLWIFLLFRKMNCFVTMFCHTDGTDFSHMECKCSLVLHYLKESFEIDSDPGRIKSKCIYENEREYEKRYNYLFFIQ